jgi:hypothetical protein
LAIEACVRCGGKLAITDSIEDPEVIAKILARLQRTTPEQYQGESPLGPRSPLQERVDSAALATAIAGRGQWSGRSATCPHHSPRVDSSSRNRQDERPRVNRE